MVHSRVLSSDKVVPQLAHKLSDSDGIGVVSDQPQHKHSILPQVIVHKTFGHLTIGVSVQFVHQLEVFLDVALVTAPKQNSRQPHDSVEDEHNDNKDEPEPQEDKDLLIEEVDGQDALNSKSLDVS